MSDLSKPDRHGFLLAFGAHPDDVELGVGATASRFTSEGGSFHSVVVSGGENSAEGNSERSSAAHTAASILGGQATLLGFPDGSIRADGNLFAAIEKVIVDFKPTIIATHYPDRYGHQDHIAVGDAVLRVVNGRHRVNAVLFYEPPVVGGLFRPNVFVEVSEAQFAKKLAAVACHDTQAHKPELAARRITNRARFWAEAMISRDTETRDIKAPGLAEAFIVARANFDLAKVLRSA